MGFVVMSMEWMPFKQFKIPHLTVHVNPIAMQLSTFREKNTVEAFGGDQFGHGFFGEGWHGVRL